MESSAVVSNGTVYVGSSDAQLLNAIDAQSGGRLWSFDTAQTHPDRRLWSADSYPLTAFAEANRENWDEIGETGQLPANERDGDDAGGRRSIQ